MTGCRKAFAILSDDGDRLMQPHHDPALMLRSQAGQQMKESGADDPEAAKNRQQAAEKLAEAARQLDAMKESIGLRTQATSRTCGGAGLSIG